MKGKIFWKLREDIYCLISRGAKSINIEEYVVLPYQTSVCEYGSEHHLSRLRPFVVFRGQSIYRHGRNVEKSTITSFQILSGLQFTSYPNIDAIDCEIVRVVK